MNQDAEKILRQQLIEVPERVNSVAKKIHWTQTPEGKAKLAARRKERLNGKDEDNGAHHAKEDFTVAYAFGRVESFIENLSNRTGVSESIITAGLAELLRHSQSGKVLGLNNSLPSLRKSAAK